MVHARESESVEISTMSISLAILGVVLQLGFPQRHATTSAFSLNLWECPQVDAGFGRGVGLSIGVALRNDSRYSTLYAAMLRSNATVDVSWVGAAPPISSSRGCGMYSTHETEAVGPGIQTISILQVLTAEDMKSAKADGRWVGRAKYSDALINMLIEKTRAGTVSVAGTLTSEEFVVERKLGVWSITPCPRL